MLTHLSYLCVCMCIQSIAYILFFQTSGLSFFYIIYVQNYEMWKNHSSLIFIDVRRRVHATLDVRDLTYALNEDEQKTEWI